jgi:hypothetical protein
MSHILRIIGEVVAAWFVLALLACWFLASVFGLDDR